MMTLGPLEEVKAQCYCDDRQFTVYTGNNKKEMFLVSESNQTLKGDQESSKAFHCHNRCEFKLSRLSLAYYRFEAVKGEKQ